MPENETDAQRKRLGRIVSYSIMAAALITGLICLQRDHPLPAH